MLRYFLAVGVLLQVTFSVNPVWAVEVDRLVITTAIVDREPIDSVEVFPVQNGKLYCFSRIVGAEPETKIYHVWYRDGQLMSRVELPVNSPDWRTWSAKSFLASWQGEWHVEIQDMSGLVLKKISFQVH